MSQAILTQGIAFATEAVKADSDGDYQRALNLYMRAIEYMLVHQKYNKSATTKTIIENHMAGYMKRAEALKKAIATTHKPKAANAGGDKGGDKDDGDAKPVKAMERIDLEEELKKIVGLDEVKTKIKSMEKMLRIDKRRQELGLDVKAAAPPHMAFYGNPGTGKTTIARLVAAVLNQLGFLEKGHLVEVQRSDLVVGYIGQTATKTRKVIESAKGGVLFVDEAYRLLGKGSKNDFGPEAIEELMAVMNDGDPVMIFAGYEQDMADFFKANEGLFRRVQRHFHFADYSCQQIGQITQLVTKAKGFRFEPSLQLSGLAKMIESYTTPAQRSAFNAALAKRIFNLSKEQLDMRLDIKATAEALMTFTELDLVSAIQSIPSQSNSKATSATPSTSAPPSRSHNAGAMHRASSASGTILHGFVVLCRETDPSATLATLSSLTGPVQCTEKRLRQLQAHELYLRRREEDGDNTVQVTVPPQPMVSDAGVIVGDVMMVLAPDKATVAAFVEADPFRANGVWTSVSVTRLADGADVYGDYSRDPEPEVAAAAAV